MQNIIIWLKVNIMGVLAAVAVGIGAVFVSVSKGEMNPTFVVGCMFFVAAICAASKVALDESKERKREIRAFQEWEKTLEHPNIITPRENEGDSNRRRRRR